jgi:hypothetical protein
MLIYVSYSSYFTVFCHFVTCFPCFSGNYVWNFPQFEANVRRLLLLHKEPNFLLLFGLLNILLKNTCHFEILVLVVLYISNLKKSSNFKLLSKTCSSDLLNHYRISISAFCLNFFRFIPTSSEICSKSFERVKGQISFV